MNLKGDISFETMIVGELNTQLPSMDRSMRLKLSKKTIGFAQTLEQMDLVDLYRTFHLTENTLFIHQFMEPSPELIMLYTTRQALACRDG